PQGQAADITASGGATITGKYLKFTNAPAIDITSKAGDASFQFTANAVSGDYVDCQCNGVTWYVNGISHVAAGLAATFMINKIKDDLINYFLELWNGKH